MTTQSLSTSATLTSDREFRYIVMWFNEFSELQREDFVPVVVEYLVRSSETTNGNGNGVFVNGLINAVNNVGIANNKPLSLFQCRLKLFREWSAKWPLDFKQKLQEKIKDLDAKVGEQIINEIKAHNISHSNGNVESEDAVATVTDDIVNAAVAIVTATEEAIMSDNRLAAVLNNETSVDDDDNIGAGGDGDDADDNNAQQINANAHVIEPAGQVQAQTVQQENGDEEEEEGEEQHNIIVIPAQTVLNNGAEVPLVA